MSFLNRLSIKNKLILGVMSVGLFSILCVLLLYYWNVKHLQREAVNDAKMHINALAQDLVQMITLGNTSHAADTVSRIKSFPQISALNLYDRSGKMVFRYGSQQIQSVKNLPEIDSSSFNFKGNHLNLYHPASYQGTRYGTAYITITLERYQNINQAFLIIIISIAAILALIVFSSIMLLQRFLTTPVMEMASLTKMVAKDHDYTKRINILQHDEIGLLGEGLNTMLHEIQEKSRMLDHVLSSAPAIIYNCRIVDDQFVPVYTSSSLTTMFGWQPRDFISNPTWWIENIHPEDKDRVLNNFSDTLFSDGHYNHEYRFHHQDGSYSWVLDEIVLIKDENGLPIEIAGSWTIINKQKELEQTLRNQQVHLEELVEQRTTEVVVEKDRAEKANQAKSDFLSKMSHDLRTPLNAILGFAQLLELESEQLLNIDQRESVDEIIKAGHHLLDLINDILDLEKIASGHLSLNLEPVLIKDILQECWPLVQNMTNELNIKLDNQCAEGSNDGNKQEDIIVLADKIRLRQILLNLISNAIKYNKPHGQVTINCELLSENHARINVIDTGNGIDEKLQGKLFKPFNRLGVEQRNIEGTGIGLVIVKNLVEMMAGQIGLESKPGQGSNFWFELPLAKS